MSCVWLPIPPRIVYKHIGMETTKLNCIVDLGRFHPYYRYLKKMWPWGTGLVNFKIILDLFTLCNIFFWHLHTTTVLEHFSVEIFQGKLHPSTHSSSSFLTNFPYAFLVSFTCAIYPLPPPPPPPHPHSFDQPINGWCGVQSWRSTLCSFLQFPVTLLLRP